VETTGATGLAAGAGVAATGAGVGVTGAGAGGVGAAATGVGAAGGGVGSDAGAAGSGAGAGAAAPEDSISISTSPGFSVSPSAQQIFVTVPANSLGTTIVALSVSSSMTPCSSSIVTKII